ncbi:uncharacterized protein EV422DRAFT_73018 [Fimicolochytrium jonesii]|uniref:uncharacterized protein n=1 Tax=Fimicolochytrium jonesii TaxID=1396493 RepID=UPI0022FE3873|nr:uncharacterized protein EV422DRAFT_73018 [Fimicolochytrium jonesii]KAI8820490.1 hypothetical protein EV422DRAFT_73018 [Fimicolochytrium jonesii]
MDKDQMRAPRQRPSGLPKMQAESIQCRVNTAHMVANIFGPHRAEATAAPAEGASVNYGPGELVWVKVADGKPFWPAQVLDRFTIISTLNPEKRDNDATLVQLFGKYDCAYVTSSSIVAFEPNLIALCSKCKSRLFKAAVDEALVANRKKYPTSSQIAPSALKIDTRPSTPKHQTPAPPTPPVTSNPHLTPQIVEKRLASQTPFLGVTSSFALPATRIVTPPSLQSTRSSYIKAEIDPLGRMTVRRMTGLPSPQVRTVAAPVSPSPKPENPFDRLEELSRQAVLEIEVSGLVPFAMGLASVLTL